MDELVLERFCYGPNGTFGRLILAGGIELFTVERPWKNNTPFVSCIPEGWYDCAPRVYHKYGYMAIEVLNVPNRTHILFHRGATAHNVSGCIAVGAMPGCHNGHWGVIDSEGAFKVLMAAYGGKRFRLHITHTNDFVGASTWTPTV